MVIMDIPGKSAMNRDGDINVLGDDAVRLSLGNLFVNLLQVVKQTNTPLIS